MKADPILEEVWRIKDKLSQEMAADSLLETGPWTGKDSANLKWLSIAGLGGCRPLLAVFVERAG